VEHIWCVPLSDGGQAAAGAAKGAVKNSGIAEMEARMILNVKPKATEAEIAEAHEKLMAMNDPAKGGSEYLQKKIIAARNALIAERSPPPPPPNSGAPGGDAKASP